MSLFYKVDIINTINFFTGTKGRIADLVLEFQIKNRTKKYRNSKFKSEFYTS